MRRGNSVTKMLTELNKEKLVDLIVKKEHDDITLITGLSRSYLVGLKKSQLLDIAKVLTTNKYSRVEDILIALIGKNLSLSYITNPENMPHKANNVLSPDEMKDFRSFLSVED